MDWSTGGMASFKNTEASSIVCDARDGPCNYTLISVLGDQSVPSSICVLFSLMFAGNVSTCTL